MWDGANTVATGLRDGLIMQARSNVTGAQQGAPAPDAVIFDSVDYENALSFAQLIIPSVGRLDVQEIDRALMRARCVLRLPRAAQATCRSPTTGTAPRTQETLTMPVVRSLDQHRRSRSDETAATRWW